MTPRHPFVNGVNLPWLRYGGDFGASRWHPDGGVSVPARAAELDETLARVADGGLDVVRWFMLVDGRAGLVERADGSLVGLDDHVRRDLDAAIAAFERRRLRVMLAITDFLLCAPPVVVSGVRTGGRRHYIQRRADRERFLTAVVEPVIRHVGAASVLYAWDVINEPEWVTFGAGTWRAWRAVSPDAMRAFIGEVVALAHAAGTHATVGLASARGLDLVRGLGLDLYQVHWYDHLGASAPLDRHVLEFGLDAPVLLGEFPSRNTASPVAEVLDRAHASGYAGALAWSLRATDDYSSREACVTEMTAWRSATLTRTT